MGMNWITKGTGDNLLLFDEARLTAVIPRLKEKENDKNKKITDATFEAETKEGLVLVELLGSLVWSSRASLYITEKLSEGFRKMGLKILKVDVDENPETARAFGIMSILLFFKDGQVVKQVAGVHTAKNKSRLFIG